MRTLLVALLVGVLAAGVAAQGKIYQVRLPDGRILFADQPPPGAVIVSEREVSPAPPAPAAAPKKAQPTLQERAAKLDETLRQRAAQRDKAYAAVQTAERELELAKERLEKGREPQEGEMLGTAKGGARFGPAYEERIAGLEKAIAAAEQKLAKAREQFNALR
jgi:hypothetical protein